jgi:SpoVK/Ycf46/Vps4 family AAA+-type ATPase
VSNVIESIGYQRKVYEELLECARDYFYGCWDTLPVKPRIAPLICGSTGVGKTFLVRKLASELSMPLFEESVGDWILLGCTRRGAPPTLPRLYKFIDRNERGIIFFDEIEKLGDEHGTDWRTFLQLEFFAVLDRKISRGVLDDEEAPRFVLGSEELGERFRRGFFLVGAGAWQKLWKRNAGSIGFGDHCHAMRLPNHEELAASLRLEILNRFSHRVLLLPPFSAEDYRQIFSEIVTRLPPDIQSVLPELDDRVIDEAVRSQKGFRLFEELVATAVRSRRILKAVNKSAAQQQHANEDRIGCSL